MDTISLANVDPDYRSNATCVQLMDVQTYPLNSNNLHELPEPYQRLYSKETFEMLITGCIKQHNWDNIIKPNRYDEELHNLFSVIPDQEEIHCYLFTPSGNTDQKNFALARKDGKQIQLPQLKKLAKLYKRLRKSNMKQRMPSRRRI